MENKLTLHETIAGDRAKLSNNLLACVHAAVDLVFLLQLLLVLKCQRVCLALYPAFGAVFFQQLFALPLFLGRFILGPDREYT